MPCSTRRWRQKSAARYAIFWGAPAHSIGPDGMEKSAVPECSDLMRSQVLGARSKVSLLENDGVFSASFMPGTASRSSWIPGQTTRQS